MLTRLLAYAVAGFILAPLAVIFIASLSNLPYIAFPPQGFTLRWYIEAAGRPEFLESFWLSTAVAAIVAVCATVIGTAVSFALRVLPERWATLSATIVTSPLVLPGVVMGIAFLQFFTLLAWDASWTSLVLAHVIMTVPYVVRLTTDSLQALPQNLEWAASSLGAAPLRAVLTIVLPCIKTGMIGGMVFAFIVSFENVTLSIFLAAPRLITLPVRIFGYTDQVIESWLVAVCGIAILFTAALILLIEKFVGLRRVVHAGKA